MVVVGLEPMVVSEPPAYNGPKILEPTLYTHDQRRSQKVGMTFQPYARPIPGDRTLVHVEYKDLFITVYF